MADYGTVPSNATLDIIPFRCKISDEKVQLFKQLVQITPIGPEIWENEGEDRTFGVPRQWLLNAKEVWNKDFDWRQVEKRINSFPSFTIKLRDNEENDVDLHFVALFSKREDALAISMAHGWPGSFFEFLGVLDILKQRYSPEDLPYHIIVPSLPGYGFSSIPKRDFDVKATAELFDSLMKGLGFTTYIAHGGDVGSVVAITQSVISEACKGLHVNNVLANPPKNAAELPIDEIDQAALNRAEHWQKTGIAHAMAHGTRPATIGLALHSNPIALLAWIGEKYLEWTDESPPVQEILSIVSIYWMTETFGSSLWPYRGLIAMWDTKFSGKPLGYSSFPRDPLPMPVSWVKELTNCTWYKRHDRGGHFPGLEMPKELLEDIEAFVQTVDL